MTGYIAIETTDSNDENENQSYIKGVLSTFLGGGQAFRTCHCRCGLSAEDKNRKVNQLGQGLAILSGFSPNLGARMVGGISLDPHALPWLSLVLYNGVIVAMGALVSDRHILTSASPLISATPANTKVTLGAHNRCVLDSSGNYSIISIILHPNFDFGTRAHDLALLKLSNFIAFDKRIIPICLPTKLPNFLGQHVTVASWSDIPVAPSTAPVYTCVPRRLRLPVLTNTECSKTITNSTLLTSDKNCLGLIGSNGVICTSDVGAPVQFQTLTGHYELIGIITDANVCNSLNSTLYIRISDHLQWIKEHIRSDCTCFKI
ncbi:proclotting enzyme-like [Arctopsyche grandis]|uniref:proclotting enzyme-like n=1 Tax=Arctopsyche grandis TaxID=121162 RepID=UPI00406D7D39